ncbi:Hypothetical protein GLP15_4680 [Giardia lamblia P15]|uniref:Uncharacterized protein n=1 Tax=Giardia intestinalis (strain P15) TaxID=658858 RepID=E1F1S4_GIAIA|nr:Hypothetical protein GLP15_4680 [Giardia lamblia P15]
MAPIQVIKDFSTSLIRSPSAPLRSRLSTHHTSTRPRPLLLGSNNLSSREPGSLGILPSNSAASSISPNEHRAILARYQEPKKIDIGLQVCLPALPSACDSDGHDAQLVLIRNFDTPTVSSLSLCMPTTSARATVHMHCSDIHENIVPQVSIKFLVGTLESLDLRFNRASVNVYLIAKSNSATIIPETSFSALSDELAFYKTRLQKSKVFFHRETYSVPMSRLTLLPTRHLLGEEEYPVDYGTNPFLMPSSINEALFTVTNPFTRQSMEVVRNPLLDASSRASLQSKEALLHSSNVNFHGINRITSPYHDRHLMNAGQILSNMTPQAGVLSGSTSTLHDLSLSCSQDKTLGSIMDDFTLQRITIEKRAKNMFNSILKSRKQCRASSLPQKLSSIPIVTDSECSIDELFSAKDVVESELSNALANDFVKAIIPEPQENFYTICNWETSKADSSYDITLDNGYLQHPVFFRTLRRINSMAQTMGISPGQLRQLQVDYLHEYKLHLTAVHNRYVAGVQKICLSTLPPAKDNWLMMAEDQRLQISTQFNILGLLRYAPVSLYSYYSRHSLTCIRNELDASDNLDHFYSALKAYYRPILIFALNRQLNSIANFTTIAVLRNCVTWGHTYRSTTLPALQDICFRTGQLTNHFFNSEFSTVASMLQTLLLQLKTEISDLSDLHLQCVCDCNIEDDAFQMRLENVFPEDRGLLSELASTYLKNLLHLRNYNYTKVLDKLSLAANLIVKILFHEHTDQLLCIKSLLFLYWRSIVPFQLTIIAGKCYYRTISYLINLEFQKHYYSEESHSLASGHRERITSRAASRVTTHQGDRDSIVTNELVRRILLPTPRPMDSYDDYVDTCIRHQYMAIPHLQKLVESGFPSECQTLSMEDVFGLIVKRDYTRLSYNPSRVGLQQQLRVVLSCPFRTLPDIFLIAARHLSAAMYPLLLDFTSLFTSTIIANTDVSDQRHLLERRAIKRLKHGRRTLAAKIDHTETEILEVSNSSDSNSDHNSESEFADSEGMDPCIMTPREDVYVVNSNTGVRDNLAFPSAARMILRRLYHLGFSPSSLDFPGVLYRVTLNLTITFTHHLHRLSVDAVSPEVRTLYGYYFHSIHQLKDSICRIRSQREDMHKRRQKIMKLAIERDSDQLARNKSLTIDDLYLTAKTDNAQLYASLAVLDADYAERLKSVKIPLDYELQQVIWKMNDASKILSEEDLKLVQHSTQSLAEARQSEELIAFADDLENLLEENRFDSFYVSSNYGISDHQFIVVYSQPHSLADVTDSALASDLVSSLLISYVPHVECSLIPLWNLALDLSTIFFTLPIMVSLYFDYFFPAALNSKIQLENPASPNKNTSALSLSLIDFYSDTFQDDVASAKGSYSSRSSSTRKSTRSQGKLAATDRQLDALKHFCNMGIFSSSNLEGEAVEFLRLWNTLTEWSSLSTLLSTQEALALPKSLAFKNTFLAETGLQKLYSDVSQFSLITGTPFENFGYCSFLNITDYNILDHRMVNDRFESIASTARLVIDTVIDELMIGSCYSAIQSALTTSSMKKVYAYISTYGKDVESISLYDPETSLYSELGSSHMLRAHVQEQVDPNLLDCPFLSARSFLSIQDPDVSNGLTGYSILHPQFHKIIPQLNFSVIDKTLDQISLYGNGFHVLPASVYQTIFAISLHELKKSMASLLTYYRYLYLYVHYASLVLITKTLSSELESLERDLQRSIDSPDSLFAQQTLLDQLARIKLPELYSCLYEISIVQYENLCTRFRDTRSVFAVDELEDSAFLLLQRSLSLKEKQITAVAIFKQRRTRFLELTAIIEDWLETASEILLDQVTTISSLTIPNAECCEKVSLSSYKDRSTLMKMFTIPSIYRSKIIDSLPVDSDADLAFFNSILSATSLLTLPPPDLDVPILLQSICREDVLLKTFVMNDNIIPFRLEPTQSPHQLQRDSLPDQLSVAHFLSVLYYVSVELLSLEALLKRWRDALVSADELLHTRVFLDSAPSLQQLHLCIQIFYTATVYPMQLNAFLQETRSWELSMFLPFIPKLYSILDSTLDAIQVLSLWTQPPVDNMQHATELYLNFFTQGNTLFQTWEPHHKYYGLSGGGFSVLAKTGSILAQIIPSGWKCYLLLVQSSLRHIANDIVCLDLLGTPSFTDFHKKGIESYLQVSDSSPVGDTLTAIRSTTCAPEFLAYLCIKAQADSLAIADLEEAEKLLGGVVISAIDHMQLDLPLEHANPRSQNSYASDLSKYPISLVCFVPEVPSAQLSKAESILACVASGPRQYRTKNPVTEVGTLKGTILSTVQSLDCLPLPLLPYSSLLLCTTYSDVVHQRIQNLRAALHATTFLYHSLLHIPRLFRYALTMYGCASFVEADVINRGIRSMADYPTLLYSVTVLTMQEATTLFNIYGQYSSLINSKLSTGTPLVCCATNTLVYKLVDSILKDLETIVHRLITAPHLSLFSKLLSSNHQPLEIPRSIAQRSTPLFTEHQPTFSPTISLGGHDTLRLKHLVPYLSGSHHFMSLLFPLWAPGSHVFISNIKDLSVCTQWVRNHVPLDITSLNAPFFPNGRQQITELVSYSETLSLVQPVRCPTQLYSLPDILFEPISSALLQCTSQVLTEFLKIVFAMDRLPLQQSLDILSFAYLTSAPPCKSDLAFELHTIINSIVTIVNSAVYDALCAAISTILKMLLEEQLKSIAPKNFVERFTNQEPILQRTYLFLHIILFTLKVRTGATSQCRDPLVLMSNKACKESPQVKHDVTYRDALYIWIIERYMLLLMLEHDLWVELRREQTRYKEATAHLLKAISDDKALAHTHAVYLSANKTFEFAGAHMGEYLRCTIYPMMFLQFITQKSNTHSINITLSNDMTTFETSAQWIGAPKREDLYCILPPQLQISMIRVLESFKRTNVVFLLLDKIHPLNCCSFPRFILRRFSRLMLCQSTLLFMTPTTFEKDVVHLMVRLAAGLLVGIAGFELLETKQQNMIIHILKELQCPTGLIPGLAVISPVSAKAQVTMESLEFGHKWSSMTIDDQGSFLGTYVTLRDACVSDVLSRPHGMGKLIVFMHCLLPADLSSVSTKVAPSKCSTTEMLAPLIDQFGHPLFVDKHAKSILNNIYAPELVYFSFYNVSDIIGHSSMTVLSKVLNVKWVALFDHSSALSTASLRFAQISTIIIDKVDESMILSRSASDSPASVALSALHYLLTRVPIDHTDASSLRNILWLIRTVLLTSFTLSRADSDVLTSAVEAYLSLQANGISDSLFYRYTVQYFYPFFTQHYTDRLSFLMIKYSQSFTLVYAATTISQMLELNTSPILMVSYSYDFTYEVAQLVCDLKGLTAIRTTDHAEVQRLLCWHANLCVQNFIVYQALTLSDLHSVSAAMFDLSDTTPILVVVSNLLYQQHLPAISYTYKRQFILPIVPRSIPREMELLLSPILPHRNIDRKLSTSNACLPMDASHDATCFHSSLLLNPSVRGMNLQREVSLLLSDNDPSFIIPLPSISHITNAWIAERSVYSFTQVTNYVIQGVYSLFFRIIFPFCLQGIVEIVRKEFTLVFGGEHKLLSVAPTKVIASLIWYSLIEFKLVQRADCSPSEESFTNPNNEKASFNNLDVFPFYFSPDSYDAYLSGELTAFHKAFNGPNPSKYAYLPDLQELDKGSIPARSELFCHFIDATHWISDISKVRTLEFCEKTVQSLFRIPFNAPLGFVHLLVFIFFAAWNAYSLVYLISRMPDISSPGALSEMGQKLRSSIHRLLTLFRFELNTPDHDVSPSDVSHYILSGYLFSALRIVVLLDLWEKSSNTLLTDMTYEQRDKHTLLSEYISTIVATKSFCVPNSIWTALNITASDCALTFASAASSIHGSLQDLVRKLASSPRPALSEVFAYILPSFEDKDSGYQRITLSYLSYKIGRGFLSTLSFASQAQILDSISLDGAILYELKKASIKSQYKKLCSGSFKTDEAGHRAKLIKLRDDLVLSAIAYSSGIPGCYQSTIQKPLSSMLFIDEPRAALVVLIAACSTSAMLYPSGVLVEVCGNKSTGKTSLIEIAGLLMQDTLGPWVRLTDAASFSADEIFDAFHARYTRQGADGLFISKLSRWPAGVVHMPNASKQDERGSPFSQLALLSVLAPPRQRTLGNRPHIVGELSLMNTTLIVERPYNTSLSTYSCKDTIDILTAPVPQLTLDHVLSLIQLAFSSNRNICCEMLDKAVSFLFPSYPDLFSNYDFLTELQRYLFWLPQLPSSSAPGGEGSITRETYTRHTIYVLAAALRNTPSVSNAKLVSILDGLLPAIGCRAFNICSLQALAPQWQVDVLETYSQSYGREDIRVLEQDYDHPMAIGQSEDNNEDKPSQAPGVKELTTELDDLRAFYNTCSAAVVGVSDGLCHSIDILLQKLSQGDNYLVNSVGSSAHREDDKKSGLAISPSSEGYLQPKVNPLEASFACGCVNVNLDWLKRFPRYFRLFTADLYLEHVAYDRQLAKAKMKHISPPDTPRYISPSLALQVLEIYTQSQAIREHSVKVISCLREYLHSPLPCTHLAHSLYPCLWKLFLWSMLMSPTKLSRQILGSLCEWPTECSEKYTDVCRVILDHAISECFFDETTEHIFDELLLLRNDSPPLLSLAHIEREPPMNKESQRPSNLGVSLDLRLSDLKESFTLQPVSSSAILLSSYFPVQLPIASLLPINLSTSVSTIPCYKLHTPFADYKQFQQISYLLQALEGYTSFLDIKLEHLYLTNYSNENDMLSLAHDQLLSSKAKTSSVCGDPTKSCKDKLNKRVLIDIDTILTSVSHVSAGEKEKGIDTPSHRTTESFVKSLSIAVLELSAYLSTFDSDFLATLMLLRTAVCLAAGVNPIYFLYTINHTIVHSNSQFGLLAPLAESLLRTPSTRYFDSGVSSGTTLTCMHPDEPLLRTHLPSILSVPGHLEYYVMHTLTKNYNTVSEFAHRFEQGGGMKGLLEQGESLLKKYLIEPSCVTILSSMDILMSAAVEWPALSCLLHTLITPGNLVRALFTSEELSIILASLSLNAGLGRHLRAEELHSILVSNLKIYILHSSSIDCLATMTHPSNTMDLGIKRLLRSPDDIFDGSLATFFGVLSKFSIKSAKIDFPTIHTISLNPLFPVAKYTAEQLLIHCKVNACQLSKIANLPEQLKINWEAHKVAVLLSCLSLHRACSRLSHNWQVPLQAYIKLTVDTIGMIFSRAQQYYANINSINSLFKVYTYMTKKAPLQGLKTHNSLYPEVYVTFFSNAQDSILPIESMSSKFLQYFVGNLVSQDSKVFGELCYMRNCLYSCLEACKGYSKLLASMLGYVCYEAPVLVACMLYGVTGLLDSASNGSTRTAALKVLIRALQQDGLAVMLPSSKSCSSRLSSPSSGFKLFSIWTDHDLQSANLFLRHFQVSLCLDTPLFIAEILFKDTLTSHEIYRHLLYVGMLFLLLGRRIFLTYSVLVPSLVFTLVASMRRFETPFCRLYETLVGALNTPDPAHFFKSTNQALYTYIHHVKQRRVELSVRQPYKQFCASIAKALAESDKAIVFIDVGAQKVPQNNYSLLRKLLLLAATTRVDARQQITLGSQITYLFQPLSEYIFVISLSPEYDPSLKPVSILHALHQAEMHRAGMLESVIFLCNLSPCPEYDPEPAERAAVVDVLTESVFGPEFTKLSIFHRRNTMFAKLFLSLSTFIDTFHSFLLEYGVGVFPINESFRSEKTIMTAEAYTQRRAKIETMLSDFASNYSAGSSSFQSTNHDYKQLTCVHSSGAKATSSVSTLLSMLREVCLLSYALIPAADCTLPLMNLQIRSSYSIGDEVSQFSISQSVNILNEIQLGYLLRSRWYIWIEECATLTCDLLRYLRAQAEKDPTILIETNRAVLAPFQRALYSQLTNFCNTTIKTALRRFFLVHSPLKSIDTTSPISTQGDFQDCAAQPTTPPQTNFVADLITFRYDSLKYPIFYYMILYPRILIDFVLQQILRYMLSRLTSTSALLHLRIHRLFLTLCTLSKLESLEDELYADKSAISKEDLEMAILQNNLRSLMDAQSHLKPQQAPNIDINLLICLCPQSLEEMSSFVYTCLLSPQLSSHSTTLLDPSVDYDLDKIVPPQFSVTKEAKQLFLSCILISRLSKEPVELLSHLTENSAAILVCSQYSCLLVTLVSLYLSDVGARSSLERFLDKDPFIAAKRCADLEQWVDSLMDAEFEKDRKYLNLTYVPLLLQKPTTKGIYLAFLLSVLLRPESFATASTLLLQIWGQYTTPLGYDPNRSDNSSIFISEQSLQMPRLLVMPHEERRFTFPAGFLQVDEKSEVLPETCICSSIISLLQAAHTMIDSTLTLVSKSRELTLASTNYTNQESSSSVHDAYACSSSVEAIEEVIEHCRCHFPLTIVFCEGEMFSSDELFALNRRSYGDVTRYSLGDIPVVYQFPSSWTDFNRHSIVCLLSSPACLADELERLLHLIKMHQRFNTTGMPAFPIWLIIPQCTIKRATKVIGTRVSYILEHLLYLVRPIIVRYRKPSMPSDLYKVALTHYFLQAETRKALTVHQLDPLVVGLLHVCTHRTPQLGIESGPWILRYLDFLSTAQHSPDQTSCSTLLFAHNLNIFLFLYSKDPRYFVNDRTRCVIQNCVDYYIMLKALDIKGSLPLHGGKQVLATRVCRLQAQYKWRKSSFRLTEKEKAPISSSTAIVEGLYSQERGRGSSANYDIDERLGLENTPHLLKDITALMCPDRIIESATSPLLILELPSHAPTKCLTGSKIVSIFDRILKNLLANEEPSSMRSPPYSELAEFRNILNETVSTMKNSVLHSLSYRNASIHSVQPSLIQMLLDPACKIEERVWKISSAQRRNDLRTLLSVLRLSLALRRNIPIERVCLLAFLNGLPGKLYLTNSGVLTFTDTDARESYTKLYYFPISLQLTDLVLSIDTYDFSIQSLVSATAEQEQGYTHTISAYITAVALPEARLQSTIQPPAGYISIPIQIGYIPFAWLLLPQSEHALVDDPPAINIADT